MHTMPQNQNTFRPRKGQQDLMEYLPQIQHGDCLTVQWPTGYGKSIGFALAWKHCHNAGIANRLLVVVANDTQREQLKKDFWADCDLIGAPCKAGIWSFDREARTVKAAMIGETDVFVTSAQQLAASNRGGVNTLKDMLTAPGTAWMIAFDEYHHFGEAMQWGEAAKSYSKFASFVMAMSATPYRRGVDTVFPSPKQVITYAEAVMGKSVKPMGCQAYDYTVSVITDDGNVIEYKTSEMDTAMRGGLNGWEEKKNNRMSGQFILPLIREPLSRLGEKRARYPHCRLQMLVRAMSCEHARIVCEQIKSIGSDYSVDWIATGMRPDNENREVINKFCPPKKNGRRIPELDVLVQVQMAGEGFDSVNVVEIVDLYPVSEKALSGRATQDKQFYGRGARIIPGAEDVFLHVNVPTDHPLCAWAGKELHAWMDSCGDADSSKAKDLDKNDLGDIEFRPLPPPPLPRDIELNDVSNTSPIVLQRFREEAMSRGIKDVTNDEWLEVLRLAMRESAKKQVAQENADALRRWIDEAVGRIARREAIKKARNEVQGNVVGAMKKKINSDIKKKFGDRQSMTIEQLQQLRPYIEEMDVNTRGLGI